MVKKTVRIITTLFLFSVFAVIGLIWIQVQRNQASICSGCNILVIIIDSLPATRVTHLGYERQTTPGLDRIAKDSISFRNAISVSPKSQLSLFSLFTGMFPTKTMTGKEDTRSYPTLAKMLKEKGYHSAGFMGVGDTSPSSIMRDFDIAIDNGPYGSIASAEKQALEWIKKNKENRFFAVIHGSDLKDDAPIPENYSGEFFPVKDLPTMFRGTLEEYQALKKETETSNRMLIPEDVLVWNGLYDSRLRDVDNTLSSFWNEFTSLGLSDRTLVIILSDRGRELYEHKRFGSGHTLYDEQIRVPLIVSSPKLPQGKVIDSQVSMLDLVPTILALVGVSPGKKITNQFHGQSLTPLMYDKPFVLKDIVMANSIGKGSGQYGIRTVSGWKMVLSPTSDDRQLFNLNDDPGEQKNLAVSCKPEDRNFGRISDLEWDIRRYLSGVGVDWYAL